MLGLDTNIIVRLLVRDDETQFQVAKRLIAEEDTFVPLTVALELEWVLRSRYKLEPLQIVSAFRGLLGLPTMTFEHRDRLLATLPLVIEGVSFADALHVTGTSQCSGFVSFDKTFVKAAQRRNLKVSTPSK